MSEEKKEGWISFLKWLSLILQSLMVIITSVYFVMNTHYKMINSNFFLFPEEYFNLDFSVETIFLGLLMLPGIFLLPGIKPKDYKAFSFTFYPFLMMYETIYQDYKRLKADEDSELSLPWNLHREITKINYRIHTDAIKTYLHKRFNRHTIRF